MAKPQTEIEKRFERIEAAVSTMATWLVAAQTGFGQKDAEGINDILYGRTETTSGRSPEETE
jgi:hypothetical protein